MNVKLLTKTARSLRVKLTGKLRPCAGCSQATIINSQIKKVTVRASGRLKRVP